MGKKTKESKKPQGGLSPAQLFALVLFAAAGGLLLWADRLGGGLNEQWLPALAVSGAAAALLASAVVYAYKRTGCATVAELLSRLLTPIPARCVMLLLAVFLTARAAQTLNVYTAMTDRFLLQKTPVPVLALAAAATALVLMYDGLRSMARTAELLMLTAIIPMLVMLAAFLLRIDWAELRVLAQPELRQLPQQLLPALYTFAGTECVLFFAGHRREKSGYAVPSAIAAAAAVSAVLFIGTVGILTLCGAQANDYPFIETARMINIGGVTLTERFDILLILLRVLFQVVQTGILLYCAAISMGGFWGMESHRRTAPLLCAVAVAVSLLLGKGLLDRICTVGLCGVLFVLMPLVFILSLFCKKEGRRAR